MILSGHIVPFLNAIVTCYNRGNSGQYLSIPNVVRVETGENVNLALSDEVQIVDQDGPDDDSCSDIEIEELLSGEVSSPRPSADMLEKGAGVAWNLGKNGLFRGEILKRAGSDGKLVLKFVNGKCYKFEEHKAKEAR